MTLRHNLDLEREKNSRQKMLDDERQRFFTNMTHELRTPLTLIIGPLEDLKNDTEIPLRQANKISLIHNSALKLLGMINRLLDFRKTELQRQTLCVKNGNVAKVVNEIVSSYKELNRNRELNYIFHISPTVPQRMLFDADVVQTVVNNLLSNAVKYTVKERRPDSTKQNSYFSGHTATAFTGAELVRIEYGWGYGAAAYAVAATTGFLRIYNKRHWVGDVLTGAGIGILCADAGYWLLPVWKRCFGIDRRDAARRAKKENKRTFVATPFYLQTDRAAGLSCSILLD